MSRRIWLLTKVRFMRVFNPEFLRLKGENRYRNRFLLMGLGALGVGVLIAFYSASLSVGFQKLGMGKVIPAVMMGLCSLLLISVSFVKSGGELFGGRDMDILLSLPIKPLEIVVSRILFLYGTGVYVFAAGMIPAMVVYMGQEKTGIVGIFNFLAVILFGPCVPVILTLCLSVVIMVAANRLPYRELWVLVLNVAVFIGILFWTGRMSVTAEDQLLADMGQMIVSSVEKVYPLAGMAFSLLMEGKPGGTLLFAVGSLVAVSAFIGVVSVFYIRLNTMLSSGRIGNTRKWSCDTESSVRKALIKKEWKRLLSSPIYAMNTLVGEILVVVLGVMVLAMKPESVEAMITVPGVEGKLCFVLPFMIAMCAGISPTTAPSLSLEGKSRWIMCSLPVPEIEIYRAKIMLNVLLAVPCVCFSSLCVMLKFPCSFAEGILILAVPAGYSIFSAVWGMLVNAKFPSYDWNQEKEAVKSSTSVFICVMSGMAMGIAPIMVVMAFTEYFPVIAGAYLLLAITGTFFCLERLKKIKLYM